MSKRTKTGDTVRAGRRTDLEELGHRAVEALEKHRFVLFILLRRPAQRGWLAAVEDTETQGRHADVAG